MDVQGDIVYDFEGSLRLARRLWSAADALTAGAGRRAEARAAARADWTGPHADRFADRAADEDAGVENVAAALRTEAVAWGSSWASALNDQNRILWARAVERERAERSTMERLGDVFVGDDSTAVVPEPQPVAPPRPPGFGPTGGLVVYRRDVDGWSRTHRSVGS
jgi:hypothetical protein